MLNSVNAVRYLMKKILLISGAVIVVILIIAGGSKKPSETVSEPISQKFGNEQAVNIRGYSDHAMEPFISRDGQYLFWNSLNDSKNTGIYYAKKINDSDFQFIGEVKGVNGEPPHLDAVPSMDINNNFYWVSTRGYPDVIENYHTGKFNNGTVTGMKRVEADFYINKPGWIMMDAEISPDGSELYYSNARFSGRPIPDEADIYLANKVGDKFVKDQNSETLFQNINTKDHIEYAPSFSADGLELFFTREKNWQTYIYVAGRDSINEPFGKPELLNIKGDVPEGASLTQDGKTLYYHKKDGAFYKIYMINRKL